MKILIFTDMSLAGVYRYIKKYQWKFWNIYIYIYIYMRWKLIKPYEMLEITQKMIEK